MKAMKKSFICSFILLVIHLGFYLFFAFFDGAVICVDSPSYINMHLSREPFYPMFLAFLRTLFSGHGDFYLTAAAFLQSLLAALATWSLIHYLQKSLNLSYWITLLLAVIPLAASLLCRFAAKRASMYSNSILTEGIACSLFLLFFRYLCEYCFKQSKKSIVIASIISFIMISTRKQMYLTLFLLILCILYVAVKSKQYLKGLIALLICSCSILIGSKLLDLGFNYAVHGTPATHSSDNRFLATMVFYTAEPEDANAIQDSEIKNLFQEIYAVCDENGYLKHSSQAGWYRRVNHFGDNYDCIQIDTMWPMIQQYVRNHYTGNSVFLEAQVDFITQEIIHSLLPNVWPKIAALTLLSIIMNVAIVSAVIFCQIRYTIYNMPLFYISGLLLLARAFSDKAAFLCCFKK